jgi:hypothetical protein
MTEQQIFIALISTLSLQALGYAFAAVCNRITDPLRALCYTFIAEEQKNRSTKQ